MPIVSFEPGHLCDEGSYGRYGEGSGLHFGSGPRLVQFFRHLTPEDLHKANDASGDNSGFGRILRTYGRASSRNPDLRGRLHSAARLPRAAYSSS